MGPQQTGFNVLMLPWLAHGHISPFLELAKKLAERNFRVYLCSTPINLDSIKDRITEKWSRSIQFVELHLPSLPELPPHHHTTNGLPNHLNPILAKAFEMASPNFSNILQTLKPDLLINDVIQPWAASVASTHNIPVVQFMTSSAAVCSYFAQLISTPEVEYPFPSIYLRDFELAKMLPALKPSSSDDTKNAHERESASNSSADPKNDERESASNSSANLKNDERESPSNSSDVLLIKSSKEIEGKYISYFSDFTKYKIIPVGPLVREPMISKDENSEAIQWLGNKDQSSSVLVSFGTEYFLSKEEMEEIANGLELSNVNFIWVIRFPVVEEARVEEALPEGFVERVRNRGMIIKGWAPQEEILRHSSIGGFVSHCGWGSVMESMKVCVPIIAIPMQLDQPLNARLMEELGIAKEVRRDDKGRLHREDVAKVIREVIVEKKGKDMWRKAEELNKKIRLRGEEEIDGAVELLSKLCRIKEEM